ncbi:succinate-semialdehyde dehydrogenase / glutarate-semialdehyde dehydrogenase [Psychroflexus salarius]|uniref:Succinate-semialdehyde dehydrogenase / glutarate-semialdehyde dehydrogenase n=1 Tax=Psychroflexus salarius TaxID=1155689 RepID=A0A1M4SFM4_9FLAO|nr:NAD-dependent succinate-semialdehyde dehydrogenase [Psychroflexus salarius]SHE30972.1 succinate-semialdehyde dehydrogenase / glutarate-semialdehyde dehydrogenase [Psychroflexus salarius]
MLKGINPYTQEEIYSFKSITSAEVNHKIEAAQNVFKTWRRTSFNERASLMLQLSNHLKKNATDLASIITKEIGKPISQSIAEIEKCAWVCEYYAENAEVQLQQKNITTDAQSSYVSYEPLGVILAVMPWNYPFWQVFRFLAPNLMAGNVGLLKHASNVQLSARAIEECLRLVGFPESCFQNLQISSQKVEEAIKHQHVKAVTLTGSEKAGQAVASQAGQALKKSVLELGGNNALVVFDDCNLEATVKTCVQARFQNNGQSCIAGKRLLIQDSIYDDFIAELITQVKDLKEGHPQGTDTYISVMAREDLAEELEEQLNTSVIKGAKIRLGGKRNQAFFEPCLVENVTSEMPIFQEETFGPVLAITRFSKANEAVELVNGSKFGLGVSVFTENDKLINDLIPQFEDGAVFVNELVKSDPRLPFGGTKRSGYGRELSDEGILEFVNKKTVYIK